jgi:hypothetical protein
MQQPMTRRTQTNQVFRIVAPTLRARHPVVHLQELGVAAPWPLAAVTVFRQDLPAGCRRHR